MNLKTLSDEALSNQLLTLVQEERKLIVAVLHHLREVERRRLFAARGYPSLFAYCVKVLGYSEGSAQRRITSMRLLKELPEFEANLTQGGLTLSVVTQAQSFFRQEQIRTPEAKREVLQSLTGMSSRQAERELAGRALQPEKLIPERVRPVSVKFTRLELVVENEALEQLEELRELLAHTHPALSISGAIAWAVGVALEKFRPKSPKSMKRKSQCLSLNVPPTSAVKTVAQIPARKPCSLGPRSPTWPPSQSQSRYVPQDLKRRVWERDRGQCTYQDSKTGVKCESRFRLQFDHIQPFALGGKTDFQNLRLFCFQHNQLAASRVFGVRVN